jgi:D-xylose 1-dehydrogenase (NADP+, D-xylono-1,5-lactone-forming)
VINIAFIGSGFGLYGLLPAFYKIKQCNIIAYCGKKTERSLNYCSSINLNRIYDKWEDVFLNEKIDAIAIAVTPIQQYEIARYALINGIHVFAEKPLALNYKQAKELTELSIKNNIITAVDFIFPEIPAFIEVKRLIKTGELGDLKSISIAWKFLSYDLKNNINGWKTNSDLGGGALSFYCSHILYYLEWLIGKINITSSHFYFPKNTESTSESALKIEFEFGLSGKGYIDFDCFCSDKFEHIVKVEGKKKIISLVNKKNNCDGFNIQNVTNIESEYITPPQKILDKTVEDERVKYINKIAERFIRSIDTKNIMTPNFMDGLRVQELIEDIRLKKNN